MKYDLVEDIESNPELVAKIKNNKSYAQNLYAALCNMQWQKIAVIPILKEELWSCSWRSAGGIVADIREQGEDYMDWYCSGMGGFTAFADEDPEETQKAFDAKRYVPEGHVTDEIMKDLNTLGWIAVPWPKDK